MIKQERPILPPYRTLGSFRFLLAMIVVMGGHSAWLAPEFPLARFLADSRAGSIAVLVFFVISGFVITEAAATFYKARYKAFAINRALKIVPAYLAALVLAIVAHAVLTADGRMLFALGPEGYSHLPDMWTFSNLLFNPFAIAPLLFHDNGSALLGEELYVFVRFIWAINVEAMFYVWVWAGILLWHRGWLCWLPKHLVKAVLAFAAVWVVGLDFVPRTVSYYAAYAPYFALGALFWHCRARYDVRAMVAICVILATITYHVTQAASFQEARSGILVCLALVYLGVGAVWLLSRLEAVEWFRTIDRRLGDLSYAVYLNQFTVLVVLAGYLDLAQRGVSYYLLAASLVVTLGVFMQRLIERPLVQVRARFRGATLIS